MNTIFKTSDGREYDLKLDFGLAKRLAKWDFSDVSDTRFHILCPSDCHFGKLYYDFGLLAAIAFAIVWEREKRNHPEKEYTPEEQTRREMEFSDSLCGSDLAGIQKALWSALMDFFPSVESDLRKISLSAQVAIAENERVMEAMPQVFQKVTEKNLEALQEELTNPGESSGGRPGNLAGVGTT